MAGGDFRKLSLSNLGWVWRSRNVFCLEDKKITDLVLCVQVLVTANEISVVGGSMRPPKVGSVVWLSP